MTGADVSVIIPVFNARRYLRRCLDSVLAQTGVKLEIICVDDCSADESREVLSEYRERDRRVAVIQNAENLGAGRCRNLGMEYASGEYLLFMDSDDWLFPGSLAGVYAKARRHRADVLRCRAADYDDQSGKSSLSAHNSLKKVPFFLFNRGTDCRRSCAVLAKVCVAPWGGLVRREFLVENKIRFNGLTCVNDRSFFWETALKAERIVFVRDFLVHYRTDMKTSLVGGRVRNFSCHFESYRLVSALCGELPRRARRRILDAELMDLAHWAKRGCATEYAEGIRRALEQFLEDMDRSPWNGRIERTRWYRRMNWSAMTTDPLHAAKASYRGRRFEMARARICSWLREKRTRIKMNILCLVTLFSPKCNTQLCFLLATGKLADLNSPRTFLEKISWLKLYRYGKDPLVIQCADKLAVRSYVQKRGLGALLNELIGVYHRPEDIPWEELPDQFVLKWNFGSGYNCILRSKEKKTIRQAVKKLKRWRREKYWLFHAEFQYKTSSPRILCERFLDPAPQQNLLDYKFYCFHGKPKAILVIDRGPDGKRGVFMTPEWEHLADIPSKYVPFSPDKPVSLSIMAAAAQKLSRPFPFVRVDFFEWRGRPIFGEMTFTPGAGIFPSEAPIEGRDMGEFIFLNQ